jgi:hypothetical protein
LRENEMPDTESHGQVAIIAFRATPELIATVEAAAAAEGITRSDVARRALIRDLAKSKQTEAA